MARRGRKYSHKKLEPPMPDVKDEVHLPKYFGVIKGGGYNKAIEERREIIPGPMPGADEAPRAISGRHLLLHPPLFPGPAPEPDRVPLLIRGARYFAAILGVEPERPDPMPKADEAPRAINVRRPVLLPDPFPGPAPEAEKVPLLIRAKRYFSEILSVEPERPDSMPVVPELNYPALYTRFPIMKTVTKVTDSNGKIKVYFSHLFQKVPGVIITIKGSDAISCSVSDTTLTYFDAIFFKSEHDHGGSTDDDGVHDHGGFDEDGGRHDHGGSTDDDGVHDHGGFDEDGGRHDHGGSTDDDGVHDHGGFDEDGGRHDHGGSTDDDGGHTPSINADGNHKHNVQGTGNVSLDTKYGRLVLSNYTDYETGHVHTQVQTQLEDSHTHHVYPTSSAGAHTHTNPNTETAANHRHTGSGIGPEYAHTHPNPSTGNGSANHVHTTPNTSGPSTTTDVVDELDYGDWCEACNQWLVNEYDEIYVATSTHTHSLGDTGYSGAYHTHTQGATGAGTSHTHSMGPTGWDGAHYHVQGPTSSAGAHTHPNIYTAHGQAHRHLLNSTGAAPSPGHRHVISNDDLYNHFVYDVDLSLNLVASSYESPYHYHSADAVTAHDHIVAEELEHQHAITEQIAHDHIVAEELEHQHAITEQIAHDHAVALESSPLLKNTAVTITYIAQIESA